MDLSIQKVSQIFRTYRKQERIAELNRQSSLKTVQQQQDQVSISTKAREQLQAGKTEGTEKAFNPDQIQAKVYV